MQGEYTEFVVSWSDAAFLRLPSVESGREATFCAVV